MLEETDKSTDGNGLQGRELQVTEKREDLFFISNFAI